MERKIAGSGRQPGGRPIEEAARHRAIPRRCAKRPVESIAIGQEQRFDPVGFNGARQLRHRDSAGRPDNLTARPDTLVDQAAKDDQAWAAARANDAAEGGEEAFGRGAERRHQHAETGDGATGGRRLRSQARVAVRRQTARLVRLDA